MADTAISPSPSSPTAARVQVIHETSTSRPGWQLCLQWCRYFYDDGGMQEAYRFIWRRPNGHLQAARGQARIPTKVVADRLWAQAEAAGWAYLGEDEGYSDGTDPH